MAAAAPAQPRVEETSVATCSILAIVQRGDSGLAVKSNEGDR